MPLTLSLAGVGESGSEAQETGWPPIMVGDLTVMVGLSGDTSRRVGESRSLSSDRDGRGMSGDAGGVVRGTGAA